MPQSLSNSAPAVPDSEACERHRKDLELVAKALAGEPSARTQLENRLACIGSILGGTNKRFGARLSPQDLPDLIQDVQILVWKKLEGFEGRATLETWLYRICTLELMNAIRRKQSEKVRAEEVLADASREWSTPQGNPMPDSLRFEGLYEGLSGVSDDEELALRLKHFEDLTFAEMGPRLDLSTGGAKHLYYRALLRLKAQIKESKEDWFDDK